MNPEPKQLVNQVKADRLADQLPLEITSVSPQKKNPDRFSLFHADIFLTGISSQTLLDFSIKKGDQLTVSLLQKLKNAEEYQSVKERCFRLLSGRDHGATELERKMKAKGFSSSVIEPVLDELKSKGFLSDLKYAEKFAHDKHHLNQWGPRKIEAALFKKGIPRQVTQKVLENLSKDLDPQQICVDLLMKRKKHFLREAEPFKQKQKMFRYLTGKGYEPAPVKKAISIMSERLNA